MRLAVLAIPPVRLAVAADAEAIARMSREQIEQGLPWSWTPERVHRAIRNPATNVVAVGETGSLAGFGIMSYLADDAHLLLFAVRADRRRQGVGSAMLAWLEAVARAAGSSRIRVEARRDNAAGRHFYNHHGYHEVELHRRMYSDRVDGVRLEKWLRAVE